MRSTLAVVVAIFSSVTVGDDVVPPRIAWYGTLQSGLAEAKCSGRPMLLVIGAS